MGDRADNARTRDEGRFRQIMSAIGEGVILVESDRTIAWANEAALSMHGIDRMAGLGATIDAYQVRFKLREHAKTHPAPGARPLDRVLAGDGDVLVAITPPGRRRPVWVHQVRPLMLTDGAGTGGCVALILRDVTERLEAEQRFEASFGVNPAPALICRLRDGVLVKVNAGFLELTGYAAEQILGRRLQDDDILDGARDPDSLPARLLRGEPLGQTETRLRMADGRSRPVIVAGQPIELDEQKCTMLTFIDLEPRRAAERALRETEAKAKAHFEALYAQAPVALHSLDGDRRIVSVSDRWLELLGYARDAVIGRPIDDFLADAEAAKMFARHWDRLLAEGTVHDLRHRFVTRSGAAIDVLLSARAERASPDEPLRTVAVLFDISERRRLEERFAKLFELAPVPMAVVALGDGRVLSVNQALLSCLSRSADSFSDTAADGLRLREIVEAGARIEALLAEGQGVRALETRLACGPNGVLDCLVSADTINIGGESHGLVVMQDITDRRRSEAQLFEAIEMVMRDTSWFARSIIERLNHLRRPDGEAKEASVEALTRREAEILSLISTGLDNREVAARLTLSQRTVRNHLVAIYGKLDVHSRSAAIIWARERGLVGSRRREKRARAGAAAR